MRPRQRPQTSLTGRAGEVGLGQIPLAALTAGDLRAMFQTITRSSTG
jgi:hypothetical protein